MDSSKTDKREMSTVVCSTYLLDVISQYSHRLSHAPIRKEAWLVSAAGLEHVFPGVQAAAEGRRGDQRQQEGRGGRGGRGARQGGRIPGVCESTEKEETAIQQPLCSGVFE